MDLTVTLLLLIIYLFIFLFFITQLPNLHIGGIAAIGLTFPRVINLHVFFKKFSPI